MGWYRSLTVTHTVIGLQSADGLTEFLPPLSCRGKQAVIDDEASAVRGLSIDSTAPSGSTNDAAHRAPSHPPSCGYRHRYERGQRPVIGRSAAIACRRNHFAIGA